MKMGVDSCESGIGRSEIIFLRPNNLIKIMLFTALASRLKTQDLRLKTHDSPLLLCNHN
jgi:hypothetical protein